MMELFQQYDVEFVSSTEKFDTSTPMGRAMLNICIVFAQLERETIQKRVADAYYSTKPKGVPHGRQSSLWVSHGANQDRRYQYKEVSGKSEEAEQVKLMFEDVRRARNFLRRYCPAFCGAWY